MVENSEPGVVRFAALIRTTGARPLPLLDALQSLALQSLPCQPLVIVHGDANACREVNEVCSQAGLGLAPIVLHADNPHRKRGYPINVGLEYSSTRLPDVEYVFMLDDDDVVYPFFTRTMAAAFFTSGADVVYAASNRREPGRMPELGYSPRPIAHLLRENFITSNSYAIRLAAIRRSGLRMNEEWDQTEDWDFLLRMLESGFHFHPIPIAVSEFRVTSDGNLPIKREPAVWNDISLQIRRYINTTSFRLPGSEVVSLCANPAASAADSLEAETISGLRERIRDLENSLSWRWTKPLRYVFGLVQSLRAQAGRRVTGA
jgi:hypothetical protein